MCFGLRNGYILCLEATVWCSSLCAVDNFGSGCVCFREHHFGSGCVYFCVLPAVSLWVSACILGGLFLEAATLSAVDRFSTAFDYFWNCGFGSCGVQCLDGIILCV